MSIIPNDDAKKGAGESTPGSELADIPIQDLLADLVSVSRRLGITPRALNRPEHPRRRPPSAVQCALALVTAGLALAAVMQALVGTAQASYLAPLPQEGPSLGRPVFDISDARAAPTFTHLPQPWPSLTPTPSAPFMSMPVEGTWELACGYPSFTPDIDIDDVDPLCLAAPTPDDAAGARSLAVDELDPPLRAAAAYPQFWQAQPESSQPARAAFLSGLIPYQAGDAAAADAAWQEMLDAFPSPEHRAQVHLWLAKIDLAFLGDSEGASAHLQQALAAAPDSFYALRAEAWLDDQGTALPAMPEDTVQAPAAPDWNAVEEWLISLWGPEELAAGPSPFALTAWQQGQELHQMGLEREATDNFVWVIHQSGLQPWSLYRLARAFDDLTMPHLSAAAATRLLAMANGPLEQAPRALLELAYPLAYPSLIQAAAVENDLSPLLLLAVIRQESFFDPLAVSPAGALGLTQVMPSTGQGIAGELNVEGFSPPDLLQPQVSIQFGARYLRNQLDLFGGNPYFALAAYNAGPDNAQRWSGSVPIPDMDVFVELIDFTETRSYVKSVLENYAIYRFLYGNADHPTLLGSLHSQTDLPAAATDGGAGPSPTATPPGSGAASR